MVGIMIHYEGKAKSRKAIDCVLKELKEIAEMLGWKYGIVDEEVRGELGECFPQDRKNLRRIVNTKRKGIWLDIDRNCDLLQFIFDLGTLELVDYRKIRNAPDRIYSYPGFSCRTQFGGLTAHILVTKIIEITEKHIVYSEIRDDTNFYNTQNIQVAIKAFQKSNAVIKDSLKRQRKVIR